MDDHVCSPQGLKAEFPAKLQPLFEPHRYKVLHGGRGGTKSWGVARALLIKGTYEPLRILCTREVQTSIADSVHKLLDDQISALGIEHLYEVTNHAIRGLNGTEFVFVGLRQQDVHKIKSYEGVDIVWCEEAHTITKRSWDILIPTIRAEGSEIWITFNPELDTDETYDRFVSSPPPDAWVQKLTYRDNPWFPEVLEKERAHCQRTDPADYRNIWEGNPRTVLSGAIYAREVMEMIEGRRVRPVPYDPGLKVHTVWDLGWNDQTSIIFVQRLHSEVRVFDYWEDSFKRLGEWVAELQQCKYVWGKDWLPHDATHTSQQTGKSTEEIMRLKYHRNVAIVPRLSVEEGIRAARQMFPRVYLDEGHKAEVGPRGGARLLECLKRYRRNIPQTTSEPGQPMHDEYSHGADAYRGLAVVVDRLTNEESALPRTEEYHQAVPGVM